MGGGRRGGRFGIGLAGAIEFQGALNVMGKLFLAGGCG